MWKRTKGTNYNGHVLPCQRRNKRHGKNCEHAQEKREREEAMQSTGGGHFKIIYREGGA